MLAVLFPFLNFFAPRCAVTFPFWTCSAFFSSILVAYIGFIPSIFLPCFSPFDLRRRTPSKNATCDNLSLSKVALLPDLQRRRSTEKID